MCGRTTLKAPAEEIAEAFGLLLEDIGPLAPRYNIAPTDEVLAVVADRERPGRRAARRLRWGLVPFFAKDATGAAKRINARAETVFRSAMFREAARRRRCLVVADGFYEWRRGGEGKPRPFYFRRRDGRAFGLAGVFDRWKDPDGAPPLESCAVLTTDANALVREVHDRMPVILGPDEVERWLDPREREEGALADLLHGPRPEEWVAVEVSTRVNSVRNDDPACIAPLADGGAPAETPRPTQGRLFAE
jgi:putative SOS response-associated peptidase YedK